MRAIPYTALLLGVLIAGLGIFGLAAPDDFAAMVIEIQKRFHIYAIAAVRIVIGVVILFAAGTSRAPFLLGVLGVLIALGGLIAPFMAGPLRQSFERWLSDGSVIPLRAWAGF